jgi:hypothetical protein
MAAGPAALAVQTGASLRAVTLWFTEDGWYAHASPDIPVPAEGNRKEKAAAMTQQLAAAFEKRISEHPQDWHMLQRVFISDLDPARLAGPQSGPVGTVPDTAVPDAAVPDAAVPDAAVPDAAVPDAAVPDAAVPDAAGPGSAGPGSTGPEAGG